MDVHVVFGHSAMGNLKESFIRGTSPAKEILVLQDDLSVGPILNLKSLNSKKNRIEWLENFYYDNEYITAKEKAKLADDSNKINQLKKGNSKHIYVWVGSNSLEELGCLHLLYNLRETNHKIILIHFPKYKVESTNGDYFAIAMLYCNAMLPIYRLS